MIHTVLDGTRGLTWVDVVDPSPSELTEIAQLYGLHATSVRDCLDPEHLPKYERFSDHSFIIIRVFDVESAPDCATVHEMTRKVAIFAGSAFIVTIHRKALPFLTAVMEAWKSSDPADGGSERSSQRLVLDLIDKGLDTYEPPLERIEVGLDEIEAALFENRHDTDDLLSLYVLRRRATLVKRMLWRSLETIKQWGNPADAPSPHYQDVRETTEALHFYADELVESVTNLTNLQLALGSLKTNQVMRILTVFSAFFLPLTFIVGVYGMNFDLMPELRSPLGYPMVLGFMAFVTLAIFLWFRKRGWLKL
jgi:magnesium transporter